MVFRDRVPLVAHSGCAAREDGSVACPALQAVVELGDRSFAVTHFTGPGRNVRVRLRIPPRIRRFARSPLPVIVRLRARDLDGGFGHKLRWVIELPR